MIRTVLAISACKLTRLALRLLHRGGTALPGKVALRLCPDLLGRLGRDVQVLLVTGTNGKTTTARMLEQAFADAGLPCFANRSGSNLIQGITAEFAENATLTGRPKKKYAVIECDEAASKAVLGQLRPQVILVTNVFRDQLDRYGEITHTLESIYQGLSHVPEATLCLNADCSLTASLQRRLPNPVRFYGVNVPLYKDPVRELSDASHCLFCKTEYEYDLVTYGHLGSFRCPKCGYSRPLPQVAVTEVLEQTADGSRVRMLCDGAEALVHINLPAGYNIYHAVGAVAALTAMGFTLDAAVAAVGHFHCGFGRMEKFQLGSNPVRMILVKNPAGCNQVLNFLSSLDSPALFVICLNDNYADGTDVSWIYDVEFEKLLELGDRLTGVLVSGKRCWDMALRLKYAGIPKEKLQVIEDYDALIQAMARQSSPVIVMPTYTAMLDLRAKLSRVCGGKDFWE